MFRFGCYVENCFGGVSFGVKQINEAVVVKISSACDGYPLKPCGCRYIRVGEGPLFFP